MTSEPVRHSLLKVLRVILFASSPIPFTIGITESRYVVADNLGIFSVLPWEFYLSVAIVLSVFVIDSFYEIHSRTWHLVMLVELTAFFFSVGPLIGGAGTTANQFVGIVTSLEAANYLFTHSLSAIYQFFPQVGGWPASSIFFGSVLAIMGIAKSSLAAEVSVTLQLFLAILDVVLFYVIMEKLFGVRSLVSYASSISYVFMGRLIPALPNDIGFSYTLFLMICVLLFSRLRSKLLPLLIVFQAIAIANFYSSLMTMAVATIYSIHIRNLRCFALSSVTFFAWLLVGLPSGYTLLAKSSFLSLLNLNALVGRLFAATSGGSNAQHIIVASQVSMYGSILLFATVVSVISFKAEMSTFRRMRVYLWSFVLLMLVFTVIVGPAFGEDPLESVQRVSFSSLPFLLAIIFSKGGRKMVVLTPLFLVLLTPVSLIAMYGPITNNYIGPPEQQAGYFLQDHFGGDSTILSLVPSYYSALGDTIYYFTNPNFIFGGLPMSSLQTSQLLALTSTRGAAYVLSTGRQTDVLFSSVGNPSDYSRAIARLHSVANVFYSSGAVQDFEF